MRTKWRWAALFGFLGIAVAAAQRAATATDEVVFDAADGYRIHADYYAPKSNYADAPMVMLLHAERSDRTMWAPLIEPLREAGFGVLALDLRGYGRSATSETRQRAEQGEAKLYKDMRADLRGAYDWLARQKGLDRARFAVIAAGGITGVATSYAVADRSVDVIVCVSPRMDQPGLDLRGDLGQLSGRSVLLLGAEDDRATCDRVASAGRGVQKLVLPETRTAEGLLGKSAKLHKEIVDFIAHGVGPPSKDVVYGSIERNIYHRVDSGWLGQIDPSNLRYYSSPQEAEARGLRASKSTGPQERNNRPRGRGTPSRP